MRSDGRKARAMPTSGAEPGPRIAILPAGDRFEDFYDKIGVSLEDFQHRHRGGWLFNYIEGLSEHGVGTVLVFASARVARTKRFVHEPSGAQVCVLALPWLHVKARNFAHRRGTRSGGWTSISSYLSIPVLRLIREIRRYGCTALLCQEYESPRFDVCVLIGRMLRLPVFGNYQGADAAVSSLERTTRRVAIRVCSGLVVGASAEIDRVRSRYGIADRKIGHIPNSVDVRVWRPGHRDPARSELGIDVGAAVVAWHGRIQMDRKGLDVLLEAWRNLGSLSTHDDLRLLLIGSGRDRDVLRNQIAALPSPEEVVWIDRYVHEPETIARHLGAADAYCLPSRHEGFAVAALEAMACGLPVVATNVPGVVDVLAEGESSGGKIVPPGAPEELARALAALLGDPARMQTMGKAARRRVEEEYTIGSVGRRLWDFMASKGAHDPRSA
jgi:glycosyltransferase involved in cell wall biosynthesis